MSVFFWRRVKFVSPSTIGPREGGAEGERAKLHAATVLREPSKPDPIESRETLRFVEIMQHDNLGQSLSLWMAVIPGFPFRPKQESR